MTLPRIKIFSRTASGRLDYIAGIILGDILGLQWEVVTDRRRVGKSPAINYSSTTIPGAFRINPDTLLFENGIRRRDVVMSSWQGLPVFFTSGEGGEIPFDIFAASFYLITRYEEYLPHNADEHGRFRASSSIACKNGFLDKPVIDLWARQFARVLLRKFPNLVFRRNEFRAMLTIDSDQPFAYLGKNFIVSMGGFIRDVADRKKDASDRFRVTRHEIRDPFEVYDYILDRITASGTEARFFFPTADHSRFDKNPSWNSGEYRDLIKKISSKYECGIHPSYYAAEKPELLRKELARLKKITGTDIRSGRFHFLRLFIPRSYRNLMRCGITEDYTMGYPDEPGFRAGIARPFFFYDAEGDEQLQIKIFPLQVMDATLYQYRKLDPETAGRVISGLIAETRKAGGIFISLWHNTSLLESAEWKGWRTIFENMLEEQRT
ncbi:MAG: polysaccharide deacetylase family protein [Bacteroidales bacterium]|jgi:hypothetical protein|nr:polysaccharide deacetylase family protein [Bacteroidales bacterium]